MTDPEREALHDIWWRCNCHDALLTECPNRERIRAALSPGPGPVDDMCPNCVTPWKCNGPHLSSGDEPVAGLDVERLAALPNELDQGLVSRSEAAHIIRAALGEKP